MLWSLDKSQLLHSVFVNVPGKVSPTYLWFCLGECMILR